MILLGEVSKAFGINGAVSLKTVPSSKILPDTPVLITNFSTPFTLKEMMGGGRLFFKEISSKEEALKLVGQKVFVDRKYILDFKEDEYFLADLLNAKVMHIESGFLGVVKGFFNNNAQELLVIENEEKQYLLPFIKEFLEKVDVENKQIITNAPIELFDI